MSNLQICQDCNEKPAVYGDGLTWSRCSSCQLKYEQSVGKSQPNNPDPIPSTEGFQHEIKEGLTSIIIPIYMVNYTLFHYTGNCIGSVREHTDLKNPYELVIVDNGSPIQPPSLHSYYADRVIKHDSNLGVTKAWNEGIRISTGEYIVLLNNDVQVFDGWLENMLEGLNNYDLVMAHPMYSLTEPFARAREAAQVLSGVKKFDSLERDFSCVAFKRKLVEEIGLFDEQFFTYCSDSDFLRRMDEAGKTYKMLDQVAVSHISDATGFSMPETPEIMNKDKATFEEKWSQISLNASLTLPDTPPQEMKTVRSQDTGDAIWLIKNGKYHHIADPDTLHALGFEFGQEVTVDTFEGLTKGAEINMQNYKEYAL